MTSDSLKGPTEMPLYGKGEQQDSATFKTLHHKKDPSMASSFALKNFTALSDLHPNLSNLDLTSYWKLLLSENHSMVKVCSPYEVDTKLLSLIHLPVKESRDYYSLADIVANGHSLDGRIINVLAAVRSVSQKINTPEANILLNYIRANKETNVTDEIDSYLRESINLNTIVDVYTVEQLKVKALRNEGKADPFYGILYAYISTLNIDDETTKVVRNRCSSCGYIVNEASNTCTVCNKDSSRLKPFFLSFDVLVDLTDHTGTLHSCSLTGSIAEETLGCTVNEFLAMTSEQKTKLKWQFLLERSKIYIKLYWLSHHRFPPHNRDFLLVDAMAMLFPGTAVYQ
ncbi:hypothetical protein STEG23_024747 [Scotinomys teguina]